MKPPLLFSLLYDVMPITGLFSIIVCLLLLLFFWVKTHQYIRNKKHHLQNLTKQLDLQKQMLKQNEKKWSTQSQQQQQLEISKKQLQQKILDLHMDIFKKMEKK